MSDNKQVNLKELLEDYRNTGQQGYAARFQNLNAAVKVADYLARCQDFDSRIIDMIIAKSSGPI
jgi:hypothetical protein